MESENDPIESDSPAQRSVAMAWLGAYAGILTVWWMELLGHQDLSNHWFNLDWGRSAAMAILVALAILNRSSLLRHRPVWCRLPGLLAVACGIYLGVVFMTFIYTIAAVILMSDCFGSHWV